MMSNIILKGMVKIIQKKKGNRIPSDEMTGVYKRSLFNKHNQE